MSKIFASIYDWINICEISQLDAILVALFVLTVGCGLIVTLFVTSMFERNTGTQQLPQRVISHIQENRTPLYRGADTPVLMSAPAAPYPTIGNFGRPRATAGLPGLYAGGPVEAAGSRSY